MSQFVLNHWASFDFVPSYYYIYFETQKNVFLGIETVRNSAFFLRLQCLQFVFQ